MTTKKQPSPSASKNVGIPYTSRSSRGRRQTVKVQFRLSRELYGLLRRSVPNVSALLRRLVIEFLEKLPSYLELEEFRLELEVARIGEELERVHRLQRLILKHGSYAEAYLQELRGGIIWDRKPHYLPKGLRPELKPEELLTVSDIVEYREALAKLLVEKTARLIQIKKSKLKNLKGGEKSHE
ncbi:hypothetical protein J7K27_05670 [Candidatus Bathyarchaeota archaeon]|nr:hypothetical protein [Candidatus Bathyarchaeota archaeon]